MKKLIKSFMHSFNGIRLLFKHERNAKIHLGASLGIVLMGFVFHINSNEWIALVLSIGLVLALEAINTALEKLSDVVMPQYDERIKEVKDIGAAAVLVAAIVSVIVGLIIFVPRILEMF